MLAPILRSTLNPTVNQMKSADVLWTIAYLYTHSKRSNVFVFYIKSLLSIQATLAPRFDFSRIVHSRQLEPRVHT